MVSRLIASVVIVCLAAAIGPVKIDRVAAAAERPPNVLFIPVDDLNDWTGFQGGHPQSKTPNLDRLAARGTVFDLAYCAAPACNPSRVALLTGLRPSTTGVYVNPQPWRPVLPDVVTLPQHFMAGGYHVIGGGKVFHGGYPDDASWHYYFRKSGDPKPAPEVLKDPRSRSGGIVWGVLDVDDAQMDDHKVTSWAVDYLKQEHDKPFFLACGIFRPHMPWQVPRKYYDMYPPETVVLPEVPEDDLEDVPPPGVKMARPEGDHATMMKTGNWRHAVQAYLASIAFVDVQIGRLLEALDESPHAENTIIVLWGDHGWHLGEKQHWRKFALWEEATRAPLIFVAPGVTKPGSVCRRPVDFINVYPTLADLCSLPLGEHLDGVTMRPLLESADAEWERPALTTHGRLNHALRSEQFRYIRYADGSEELYDHLADPMEWKNLADDPRFAKTKADLKAWLPKTNAKEAPYDQAKRGTPKKKK